LTESFENYDLNSGEDLIIEWTVPKAQRVNLQANGLRSLLYYRMDTVRAPESTSYRWPTDILRSLEISRDALGVIGWARYSMDGVSRDIYLPLRIGQKAKPVRSQTYRVILWPGQELTEVYISLASVTADGSPETFIRDGKPLEYGYYPAQRGIQFDIPKAELEKPGVHYLEIGATLESGGSVTIERWFYHAG
jgi:hypothetical protein